MARESSSGYQVQTKGDGVTVTQNTDRPDRIDTIVSEKGSPSHTHHVASKETGRTLWEGINPNKGKKK
jgi:hypothetical protein